MSRYGDAIARVIGQPHRGRFASLEGYRAVAALSVVVYHTRGNLSPLGVGEPMDVIDNLGNFGVAVFFLLSGFLLYLPVSRRLFSHQQQAPVGRFLLRRFVRIFPAYWLAVIGWAAVVDRPTKQIVTPWKVFLLFDGGLNTLGVAWTLVIELWFYVAIAALSIALPLLLRRCRTTESLLRAQLVMLGLMVVVAYGYRVFATTDADTMFHYVNWIVAYLDWFAYGMLMAILVAWVEHGGRLPNALRGIADRELVSFALAAACYLAVMYAIHLHPTGDTPESRLVYLFHQAIQPVAAFWLLVPATMGRRDQMVQRALRRPTLAGLGTISYGIYLWHTLVIRVLKENPIGGAGNWWMVVDLALVLAVTIVIATVSYRLVERPALSLVPSTFERLLHREPLPFSTPAEVVRR